MLPMVQGLSALFIFVYLYTHVFASGFTFESIPLVLTYFWFHLSHFCTVHEFFFWCILKIVEMKMGRFLKPYSFIAKDKCSALFCIC